MFQHLLFMETSALFTDGTNDIFEEDDDYNECSSPENEEVLNRVLKKGKEKGKKKRGRKSVWEDNVVEDLVDILINNEVF